MKKRLASRKNWKAIIDCDNFELRSILIEVKGRLLLKMKRGFPEYFLAEGAKAKPLKWSEFKRLMNAIQHEGVLYASSVISVCDMMGIRYEEFDFSGSSYEEVKGVPYIKRTVKGKYYLARDRIEFVRSSVLFGQTIEYKKKEWIVVCNRFCPYTPDEEAYYEFVIVPVSAFEEDIY